ncbi:MAG: hypothetical protein LQ337_007424 [Flavoplaca oasis]|nr:MAG: hypothetical protein LQ337_007424 [Flavoplaca oasis]
MPRTFKFSFPLPGRKASDDKDCSLASLNTPTDSHDNSPLADPGSKAERLLGTLDPAPSTTKASRKALRKKPSFMSVTISETESDVAARDGFPFPGMPDSRDPSPCPSHILRNQSSSPLLGERYPKASPGTDSISDKSSPRPHFYGSSSTLRSYYDPARSPLSISQQTSASSARDMALRKGQPIISSPLSQDASKEISPAAIEDEKRPTTNLASAHNLAPLDLSDLFPQPHIPTGPILSTNEVSKSPTQLSYPSSPHSGSAGRPNWWKRRKAKESHSKEVNSPQDDPRLDRLDLGVDTLKMNIKKPKAGMHYWFDALIEDPHPGTKVDVGGPHGEFWNKRLDNLRHETGESSGGHADSGIQGAAPAEEDSIQLGLPSPSVQHQCQDSRKSQAKETSSNVSPNRARSRSVTSAKADLLNESFLELSSSSDDESEQPALAECQNRRRHLIRDSIDQNAIADDSVLVTSAERIRPVKPKPVINTSPRRSKRGSEVIPPVPKIPERPQLQQRISSMRWRESTSMKSPPASTISFEDSSMASPPPSFKKTSTEPQDPRFGHGSKMMTVTAEESELLEAMRKKRANIRQEAARNFGDNQRPETASTDGQGSYFGSDRSGSPHPTLPASNSHMYRSSNGSDGAHRSFAFPQVPSSSDNSRKAPRQAPPIVFPPPKCSPSASSFNTSDMMPSTPRSNRLSPITPISPAQEDDFGGSGNMYCSSLLGMGKGKVRHERKRTMSSGVVMLDAVGEGDKGWELEDEAWGDGREERW